MKTTSLLLVAAAAIGLVVAQNPRISRFDRTGVLEYSPSPQAGVFSLQHASNVTGPWSDHPLWSNQPITNDPMQLSVGVQQRQEFLRIVEAPNTVLPTGVIVMWSGSLANIPTGWKLCDGSNGTPDLRNRFIVGAAVEADGVPLTTVKGSPMQTGGEHEHTLTIAEMPSHSHSIGIGYPFNLLRQVGAASSASGNATTNPEGGGKPHENCPPFFALAFIMKE